MRSINNTKTILAVTFLIYLIFGLVITFPSLTYPMVWDDLHLIRNFSPQQILNSFHGLWDPDGCETQGLRPLTMIFNQVRFSLFGENVVFHHLFLTLLNTIFFWLFGWINHRLGIPWKYTIFAGLISFFARFNLQNTIWLADGIHAFSGIFECIALICLIHYLDTDKKRYAVISWLIVFLFLFIREENLAAIPIIFIASFFYWHLTKKTKLRSLVLFYSVCTVTCIAFYSYDSWLIPSISKDSFNIIN